MKGIDRMIESTDVILTAYAESCAGPGWTNTPLWIIVQDQSGKIRRECLQPEEQTLIMKILFSMSNHISSVMRIEVEKLQREGR